MKYLGSKRRHAKEILEVFKNYYEEGMLYVEPFVGGGNMIDVVPFPNKIGYDVDINTISALISIRDTLDDLPNNCLDFTKEDYVAANKNLATKHRGYIGYALSYGGKWFGGWRADSIGKRDYVAESYRDAQRQSTKLQGIVLNVKSVFDIKDLPTKALIYCDPPYRDTTKYSNSIDHDKFYEWCRSMRDKGHVVFVSEYWMPEDFECVWEKSVKSNFDTEKSEKLVTKERLFLLK